MTDERKPETPGMSEVSPKFVDEAEAATTAPPSSASVTDAPLVAVGRQWKEVYGKWVEADVYPDTSDREEIRKYEKERTVLLLAISQLEDQAAEVSARTVDGVLVQLRMAGTHYHLMERDGEQWGNTYAKLTWQAWDGLERLVGSETPTDEALSALWQEHERLTAQYSEAIKETDLAFTAKQAITDTKTPEYGAAATAHEAAAQRQQETSDASVATENRMAKIPARTVMGTLLKLRVAGAEIAGEFTACDGVFDETLLGSMERLILSALADLERLSGVGIAVAPASVTEPTDPLVLLGQCWEEIKGKREQLKNRDDENPKHPDVIEDERLHDIQLDIEKSIADTPTRTAAGVAVKLRHLQRDDEDFDGMSDWHPAAFRTALEALACIEG